MTNESIMKHTFNLDKSSIRLIVSNNGEKYRKSTGLTISPALWIKDAKSLRAKCKDNNVYEKLRLINLRMEEKEAEDATDVNEAIEYALTGVKKKGAPTPSKKQREGVSFWEYFEEWGKRPSSTQRQRLLTTRVIARLMGKKENWEDIDSAYYFRLQKKMDAEGFSINYKWNIATRLKCVMNEGLKLKYHNNTEFQQFVTPKEKTEAIALTPEEINLLWKYKPKSAMYGKCRDLFLIGYYTGARFSDYSRISDENIKDGKVEFVQQKTNDKVIIPASPRLIKILERNGGVAPNVNQVVFNRYIKLVAKDAGINGVVPLPKSHQKEDGSPTYRWEMVMSHTARRSAITNLYLSGVSARDCMFLSGHRSIRAFENYIKISKEQAAERLAKNKFFN